MDPNEILEIIRGLTIDSEGGRVFGHYPVVLRAGGFLVTQIDEFEAGDIVIVPPTVWSEEAPTESYIQYCIGKCWLQIKDLKL